MGLLAVPLFVPVSELRRLSKLLQVVVPILVSGIALAIYNHLRWGSFFTNYGGPHGFELGFTTPITTGLSGLLLSPGKSIFVFNPLTLLGAAGMVFMFWRDRPLAVLVVLLVVPRLLFFAMWSSWDGGWSWGPRFLLPAVPLLTLTAVDLIRAVARTQWLRWIVTGAACSLGVLAVWVNFLSVRVPYEEWLTLLQNRPVQSAHLIPDPRAVNYDFDVASGPLNGDMILLEHGAAQMAPFWWTSGQHQARGDALLAGSAALIVASLVVASRPQRAAK